MSFGSVTEQILHGSLDFKNHLKGAERKRALDCIAAMTSDERECYTSIMRNAMNSEKPIKHEALKIRVSEKLSLFSSTSADSPIPQTKDEGKCILILGVIKIWRILKDIFGYRTSDEKIEKKIHQYAEFAITQQLKGNAMAKHFPFSAGASFQEINDALQQIKTEIPQEEDVEEKLLASCTLLDMPSVTGVRLIDDTTLVADLEYQLQALDESFLRALESHSSEHHESIKEAYQNLYIYTLLKPLLFPSYGMHRTFQEAEQGFTFAPTEDNEILLKRSIYLHALGSLIKTLSAPAAA